MAINPNTLEWGYRTFIDGNSEDQKANYSLNFTSGGQEYTFIPQSVIERGIDTGDKNYVFPAFLNQDNLTKLGETGQSVDLDGVSWYGDYLKNDIGASTKGILVPSGSFDFGEAKIVPNNVRGVGTTSEGLSYIMETPEGKLGQYLASDGKVTTLTKTRGSSLLGNVFGDWVDDFTTSTGIAGVAGEVNDFFETDIGKAIKLAALASNAYNFATAPDPNAVGGVTGPDNIDVGGGWSPAAGATAAQLEAARIALGTPEVVAPELTAQEVLDKIQADQASSMTAAETQAMIDAEAAEAAAVASATPEQVAAAKASGMSMLDYARAGLLVNAITGDPLGLGGGTGGMGGTGGTTGFAQVPIPAEWKSPTYAAPSAPIDLSAIFSNQNMLGGTQWQNLPTQQPNISFNDIFTAGKQQTPMGTPVDINQIVSAILGQTATSQKSS